MFEDDGSKDRGASSFRSRALAVVVQDTGSRSGCAELCALHCSELAFQSSSARSFAFAFPFAEENIGRGSYLWRLACSHVSNDCGRNAHPPSSIPQTPTSSLRTTKSTVSIYPRTSPPMTMTRHLQRMTKMISWTRRTMRSPILPPPAPPLPPSPEVDSPKSPIRLKTCLRTLLPLLTRTRKSQPRIPRTRRRPGLRDLTMPRAELPGRQIRAPMKRWSWRLRRLSGCRRRRGALLEARTTV